MSLPRSCVSRLFVVGGVATVFALGACSPCPSFSDPVVAGTVTLEEIVEASGLAASRVHEEVLWTHNDSGGAARLYALGTDASWIASFDLVGAQSQDWEDLAVGPGPDPGLSYLYVGDIGDNGASRSGITVYRVAEPALPATPSIVDLPGVEALTLVYPDGAHDAEALFVDPWNADLYIVTKATEGAVVFRAAAPLAAGSVITLEEVAAIDFGAGSFPARIPITGGDIDSAGEKILLRTYARLLAWCRDPGQSVAEVLGGEPCDAPVAFEPQGEAVAFASDGSAYFTLSEFAGQPLYRSDRTD